ncbi:MAG: amidohydrolase [Deltaproteobacteria bacterium]|nr:amidohydrolase [Deltaproteobacteria bacterium]
MSRTGTDLIIEGGILLSRAKGADPLENARVWIRGDRIHRIETGSSKEPPPPGVEVIDARKGLIMPGLVNAHCHTAMTLFRGLADDLPLKKWLFEKIFPAEAKHLSPDTVYWGSLLGCLEMIASGTTTFVDGYFFQDSTIRAAQESGLRALVAQGVIDFPAPGVPDPGDNLKVGEAFLKKWSGVSDRIFPGLFCHSPLTCSESTLRKAAELSAAYSAPLQIHLSETVEEIEEILKKTGRRPVHYLERLGILRGRLIAAHAVHVSEEEIRLLAERDVKIVHVPESNMKLASGIAPIPRMMDAGLVLALGTDGCASNNNLDLFQEMDCAAKLHKVAALDPECLDAESVLHMATLGGAELLGLEKEIGTIEVGKKADIIVVDLESPHLTPCYSLPSTLVYSAVGADVKDVLVDGKVLMKDRTILTLDAAVIMERVRAIAGEIG